MDLSKRQLVVRKVKRDDSMTKSLWIFPKYSRKGASSRLRLYQYLPQLEQAGFSVHIAPLFSDEYLDGLYAGRRSSVLSIARSYLERVRMLRTVDRSNLLIIQGELFPWVPAFAENLLLNGRRYVLDYDDAVFHRYDLHRLVLIRSLLGRKIDRLMARAHLVIVGNAYLAERAHQAGARQIEVLPTVVDTDRYPVAHFHSRSQSPRVGWIGTPITWASYGKELLTVLSRHFAAQPVEFLAIGASTTESHKGNLHILPWTEETEAAEIASLSVGLMPLKDTPWARGKCGYKLIQYLACGVPVIASPVGANCEIVNEGENGYLATTLEEWQQSIAKLLDTCGNARQMGMRGREIVHQKYSVQSAGSRLVKILRRVLVAND
jgi:glycosyltransferase involved in cell wall biosynthesis